MMYKSTKYLLDMNENRIVAIRHVFTAIRKRYHAVETWKTFAISIPRKLYIVAFQFIAGLPANFDVLYAKRDVPLQKQKIQQRTSRLCLMPFLYQNATHNRKKPEHAPMGNELMNECDSMNVTHFYVIYYYLGISLNTCPRIKREPRSHVTY
jgi:hypothetical protein